MQWARADSGGLASGNVALKLQSGIGSSGLERIGFAPKRQSAFGSSGLERIGLEPCGPEASKCIWLALYTPMHVAHVLCHIWQTTTPDHCALQRYWAVLMFAARFTLGPSKAAARRPAAPAGWRLCGPEGPSIPIWSMGPRGAIWAHVVSRGDI